MVLLQLGLEVMRNHLDPKQESQTLLNSVFPVAEMMLREYGEFYRYGGYMTREGEIVHVGAKDADTDYPLSEDLITLLRTKFREMARARQCKIVALIFDVRVKSIHSPQKKDAIQACLDHVDGYSVEVFFPYQIIKGEIVYGETYAHEGKHEIFAKPAVQ